MPLDRTKLRSSRRRVIQFTPAAFDSYKQTVAKHPPETCGILGGSLDDPFRVTDFIFAPPLRRPDGGFDASSSHLSIDHEFINWAVDFQLAPNNKYILGILHSHPGNYTSLSPGDRFANIGDIAFFTSCLENDDSPKRNWHYFLAPITTFRADGTDIITGWLLKRGSPLPLRCDVIAEPDQPPPRPYPVTLADLRAELSRQLLLTYTTRLGQICQDPHLDHLTRQAALVALASSARAELDRIPGNCLLSAVLGSTHPASSA
jgi:proteasome lid subunit RPN8/RPN11